MVSSSTNPSVNRGGGRGGRGGGHRGFVGERSPYTGRVYKRGWRTKDGRRKQPRTPTSVRRAKKAAEQSAASTVVVPSTAHKVSPNDDLSLDERTATPEPSRRASPNDNLSSDERMASPEPSWRASPNDNLLSEERMASPEPSWRASPNNNLSLDEDMTAEVIVIDTSSSEDSTSDEEMTAEVIVIDTSSSGYSTSDEELCDSQDKELFQEIADSLSVNSEDETTEDETTEDEELSTESPLEESELMLGAEIIDVAAASSDSDQDATYEDAVDSESEDEEEVEDDALDLDDQFEGAVEYDDERDTDNGLEEFFYNELAEQPDVAELAALSPVDRQLQPVGEHCIVIGRMSSNKGISSRKGKSGKKGSREQIDHKGNLKRRRREGRLLGDRLCQNAPVPFTFRLIVATFNKMLGSHTLDWMTDKLRQSKMVTDVKSFFNVLPPGSKATICIRALDGLTTSMEGFWSFVQYVVQKKKIEAKFMWQIGLYTASLRHRRMQDFKGLGAVIVFTGEELRAYAVDEVDSPQNDVAQLVDIIRRQGSRKASTNRGLQNRNKLPDSGTVGAEEVADVGGEDVAWA